MKHFNPKKPTTSNQIRLSIRLLKELGKYEMYMLSDKDRRFNECLQSNTDFIDAATDFCRCLKIPPARFLICSIQLDICNFSYWGNILGFIEGVVIGYYSSYFKQKRKKARRRRKKRMTKQKKYHG